MRQDVAKAGKSGPIYERYKVATSAGEVLALGGRKGDLQNDLQRVRGTWYVYSVKRLYVAN